MEVFFAPAASASLAACRGVGWRGLYRGVSMCVCGWVDPLLLPLSSNHFLFPTSQPPLLFLLPHLLHHHHPWLQRPVVGSGSNPASPFPSSYPGGMLTYEPPTPFERCQRLYGGYVGSPS